MALKAAEIRAFPALVSAYRKTDEKGLYLEIRPNGAKRWFFKYRVLARSLITHCTRCARR
ncbi:Arm DNA-binding domain-containing protein [Sphingobium yanoikuyae]|uniref:Arm DNA-binding domain-containing protein n=1 Tax=Sphingobium yanoikuyae TaxID=13690 RepID=UPI0035E44B00